MDAMKLTILTKIPSPYQVELFDAVANAPGMELTVVYVRQSDADRNWSKRPVRHRALYLENPVEVEPAVVGADLVVFSWYRHRQVRALMSRRVATGRPWCFWGERPGIQHKGGLGAAYRRIALWRLWRDHSVPIWGIGHWAIEGYRREFGSRPYYHMPYVSDLRRFFAIQREAPSDRRTVLFSGSLIARKGIEELCDAFREVARRRPGVRLLVMGTGPLESMLKERHGGFPAIHFLGFRDWDDLPLAYREADLLCAPSRYDGWGLIVPEAMASGLPVIASTEMGSAREMIEPGINGWLVAPNDQVAIARALEHALDLPTDDLRGMREACREKARQYDLSAGSRRLIDAARTTIENWQRAPAAATLPR